MFESCVVGATYRNEKTKEVRLRREEPEVEGEVGQYAGPVECVGGVSTIHSVPTLDAAGGHPAAVNRACLLPLARYALQ